MNPSNATTSTSATTSVTHGHEARRSGSEKRRSDKHTVRQTSESRSARRLKVNDAVERTKVWAGR
jgi:hypothetical protein